MLLKKNNSQNGTVKTVWKTELHPLLVNSMSTEDSSQTKSLWLDRLPQEKAPLLKFLKKIMAFQ